MSILRKVQSVGLWTLVSRVFGYIRDLCVAYFLGAGHFNDVFIVALRIPNLFRSAFGEGAFNISFAPLFASKVKTLGTNNAMLFARNVQSILLISLIVLSCFCMFFMKEIVSWMMPGYSDNKEILDITTNLSILSFPYIIFISMTVFYGAMCNAAGRYWPFTSASTIFNIVLISFIFLGDTTEEKLFWLILSIPIAGLIEMLWLLYFVVRDFGPPGFSMPKFNKDVAAVLKRILPALLGSGVTQINAFISTLIASFTVGGISYIYYADRIYQLPLAIIGTAIGTVMLTELSKKISGDKLAHFTALQAKSISICIYFSLPATLLIFTFSHEIVELVFKHGSFSSDAAIQTAKALSIFATAIPAYSILKILSTSFFAQGNTKTPMQISVVCLMINVILSFALMPVLKHCSVAVGSVVASYFGAAMLLWILIKHGKMAFYKRLVLLDIRNFMAALLSYLFIILAKVLLNNTNTQYIWLILAGSAALLYLTLAKLPSQHRKSFRRIF